MHVTHKPIYLTLLSVALLVACGDTQAPAASTVQSGLSSRMEALMEEIGMTSDQRRLFRQARDQVVEDRLVLASAARDVEQDILQELQSDTPDRWWLKQLLAINADSRRSFAHDRLDALLSLYQMLDTAQRTRLTDRMMRRTSTKGQDHTAAETRRLGDAQGESFESMIDEIELTTQQRTALLQMRSRLHELQQIRVQIHRTGRTEMINELRNENPDEVWLHTQLDDRVVLLEGLSYRRLDALIQLRQNVDEIQWSTIKDRFLDRLALSPGTRQPCRDEGR